MIKKLAKLFADCGNRQFIKADEKWVTYKDFLAAAGTLSRELSHFGDKPRVCVVSSSTLTYFLVFFACLLRGGRYIPIDSKKGAEERNRELSVAVPDIVISDGESCDYHFRTVDFDSLAADGEKYMEEFFGLLGQVNTSQEFLITFTSGTTSEPKGVVHSFDNLAASAIALGNLFEFSRDSIFYHTFPPSYMAGVLNQFVLPMVFGSKIIIGDRFSVQAALRFWDKAISNRVNVFWMSPTILRLLLSVDRDGKGKKYCSENDITIITATAPLPVSLRLEFETTYQVQLYESFGLTETLFNATNHPNRTVMDGCAGYVLPGTGITLQEDGELALTCEWMFLRYLSEPEGNAVRTEFHTGDLAEIWQGGLFITGRKKDLIIRGGMNISPRKIERELDDLILGDFAVLGMPDSVMGEKTALVYVDNKELEPEEKKRINQRLISLLGSDYVVDLFVRVSEIPQNATGKKDKNRLRKNLIGKVQICDED